MRRIPSKRRQRPHTSKEEMDRLRRESQGRAFLSPAGIEHHAENSDLGVKRGPDGKLLDGQTTFGEAARKARTGRQLAFALIAQQCYSDEAILRKLKEKGWHRNKYGQEYTLKDINAWRDLLQQGRQPKGFGRPPEGVRLRAIREEDDVADNSTDEAWRKLSELDDEDEINRVIKDLSDEHTKNLSETASRMLEDFHSKPKLRRLISTTAKRRSQDVGIVTVLKRLYGGRCQICRDTFLTIRGEPYCEGHHIRKDVMGVPDNIIILCATCHRKMHHARVRGAERMMLTRSVQINGTHLKVTVHESHVKPATD